MDKQSRRSFLKTSGKGIASTTAFIGAASSLKANNASDRIIIGILGGSRGRHLAKTLSNRNIKISYICDPDEKRLRTMKKEVKPDHAVKDFRKILADRNVDVVIVATPDHWHGPATIMACDAGKHVYVEKPCSHNIREGRLMVEAARRNKRIVTVGTQSRSTTALKTGINLVRNGEIGDVLIAKAWNSQRRSNIGHKKPSSLPKGFDYDLWTGPAPMRPFQENCHHYSWHWWYDFGTGDAGNDGVHEIDIAAWGLGVTTHPSSASGYATKMFFDDDQQFPDTQYVTFSYPGNGKIGQKKTLIYEHRIWSHHGLEGVDNGNAFYGTKGHMLLSKRFGWKLYKGDKLVKEENNGPCRVPEHITNFLEAVHSGRTPSADIEIGHRSAVLAHLANLLGKTGKKVIEFDPESERIPNDPEADKLVTRTYRDNHWAVPKGV